jgi:hypothetical protein
VVAFTQLGRQLGPGAVGLSVSAEQLRQLRQARAYRGVVRGFRFMALSLSTVGLMLAFASVGLRGRGLGAFFGVAFLLMIIGVVHLVVFSPPVTAHAKAVLNGSGLSPSGRASLLPGMVLHDVLSIRRATDGTND